jgi:hypothetical protein
VCDIPYRPIVSIFANTCRTHWSECKWYTAGSLHFHSQGPQDRKSSDLTLRICVVIIKCHAANTNYFKKLKRKTTF